MSASWAERWLEAANWAAAKAVPQTSGTTRASRGVGVASQPFWLHWHDGQRPRRHAPDYFVRLADGRARVVDVRAGDQIDEVSAEAFAATARACRAVGWEFVRVGVPDPVLMANIRWLVRYRRARSARRPDVVDGLLDLFTEPGPLALSRQNPAT